MADPTQGPCKHCGAVLPLAEMLRITAEGEYVFVCPDCAVAVSTGPGPGRAAR